METNRFKCEIVTPMFLAGADRRTPELRSASIKGALRFWWRAMHGHLPTRDLHKQEAALFGGVGDNPQKSRIIIRTSQQLLKSEKTLFPEANYYVTTKGQRRSINLLEYLAYGTYDYNKQSKVNQFNRGYYSVKQKFDIIVSMPDEPIINKSVFHSLFLISIFGGLGARNRNGYGRFYVEDLQNNSDYVDLILFIKSLKKGNRADYTCFSNDIKLLQTNKSYYSWSDTLSELAKAYKSARETLDKPHCGDNRQYISSPLMIDKVNHSFLPRHSKPYFFGILKNGMKYDGYILFLPYYYCQNSEFELSVGALSNYDQITGNMNKGMEKSLKLVIPAICA